MKRKDSTLKISLFHPAKRVKKSKKKKKKSGRRRERLLKNFFTDEQDYSKLKLQDNHERRPLWVLPDNMILLETFSPVYEQAYDFLVAIAEPVRRPTLIHEYKLTDYSLYAAVALGLETSVILNVLEMLSKTEIPIAVKDFVYNCTNSYGKVRLLLYKNSFFMESEYPNILQQLLDNPDIKSAHIPPTTEEIENDLYDIPTGFLYRLDYSKSAHMLGNLEEELASLSSENVSVSQDEFSKISSEERERLGNRSGSGRRVRFYRAKIETSKAERVMENALKAGYPLLEEYDYLQDTHTPGLNFDLNPICRIRTYQEKSLSKMFGNGHARSGIIVLPCGAGKTLVGITAACSIKKSVFVVTINNISVEQWAKEFEYWTNIAGRKVCRFTSKNKDSIPRDNSEGCIVLTTYNMITTSNKKSKMSEQITARLKNRDWGLLILDEVHVAPAQSFRRVIEVIKAHCKLGLTATLLREDGKESDLYYLIGPKHYEANWLDLQRKGFLADVRCVEIWCPMSAKFNKEYLDEELREKKKLFYVMNPIKIRTCEYLMRFHEKRGDKCIIFSDNIYALEYYARLFLKPMIHGKTPHDERIRYLNEFRNNPRTNVLFLSKVGDVAIDIPNANVIIQVSSHFGSRRQEAQRLGRILRPKDFGKGYANIAYFYTLVSKDTKEMFYSTKRQQFLIDQGYSFKVIDGPEMESVIERHPMHMEMDSVSEEEIIQAVRIADKKDGATENLEEIERDQMDAQQGGRGRKKGRRGRKKKLVDSSGDMFGITMREFQKKETVGKYNSMHPIFKKHFKRRKVLKK